MSKAISQKAKIGKKCRFGENVVIEDEAQLGDNVSMGHNVIIHRGTIIGNNVSIGDQAILGKEPKLGKTSTVKLTPLPVLEIGTGSTIGASAVIFRGSKLGQDVMIGDGAEVRENCRIGDYSLIGQGVTIENDVVVGSSVKIQTGAYITAETKIEDHVFIAPMVVTTNDNFMGRTERHLTLKKGPTIKKAARIGANATLLPGIVIGEDAFVAAGSVVTKDVPARKLVMGVPARVVRDVPEEELL